MSEIAQRVESVSMALVMAEPSDLQALSELHEMLSQISAMATEDSQPVLASAAAPVTGFIDSSSNKVPSVAVFVLPDASFYVQRA